jgi:hypothetical protein
MNFDRLVLDSTSLCVLVTGPHDADGTNQS